MMKKGFMHSLEAIIASLLLLTYALSTIQYPQPYSEWAQVKQKQVAREYLSAFNDAGLSTVIVEGRADEFVEITRYFLGFSQSFGLYTEGLLPQNIVVGVLSNETATVSTEAVDCALEGVPSEYGCYNATFLGYKFVLVDNDTSSGGVGNGVEDYDSIYFDSDDSGYYDVYEGPRTVTSTVNTSSGVWIFSALDNSTHDVEFIRGDDVVKYRRKLTGFRMNNRQTNVSVRAKTNVSDFSDVDVLVVPTYVDLSGIKSKLVRFLDAGRSIVEVADVNQANLDDVQRDIFGLQYVGYDTRPSYDRDVSVAEQSGLYSTIDIGKYFNSTNIRLQTPRKVFMEPVWSAPDKYDCYLEDTSYYLGHVNCTSVAGPDPCITYTIEGVVNYVDSASGVYCRIGGEYSPDAYFYGEANIRGVMYSVLAVNATGSAGYDSIVVDADRNMNFTNDGPLLDYGDSIGLGGTVFEFGGADPDGRYVEIRPASAHRFVAVYPDKLYSVHNDTSYVVLEEDTEYNVTTYDTGYMIEVAGLVDGIGTCTLESLLSGSDYKSKTVFLDSLYAFTVTNISQGYNVLNIDLDSDGECDGPGEGPIYSGDLMRLGPEFYRVDVAQDGSAVNWTLDSRFRVPAAIVNHRNGFRKTAWIKDGPDSDDRWHVIRSVILWSSKHTSELLGSKNALDSVVVSSTFVENSDVFQPYKVYFRS